MKVKQIIRYYFLSAEAERRIERLARRLTRAVQRTALQRS